MKHYNLKPIRLTLQPSRQLALILAAAGIAACAAVLSLPLSGWQRLGVIVPIAAATLYHVLRDALLRMPRSVVAIEVGAQGEFRCQARNGDWQGAAVQGDSFVTTWLTVLNLRVEGERRRRHALLLSDSADTEMLRRLRVWLRWGSADSARS